MKNTLLTLALALVVSNANAGTSAKNPVAAPPPPAPACNSISYDFVEGGYGHIFNDDGADADGAYLTLSSTIAGNLFGFAEVNQYFSDDGDLFSADAGLGYHVALTSCIDWVIKAAIVYDDPENGSEVWSGIAATGFRVGLAKWLELDAFYHVFWEDFDRDVHGGSVALIFREIIAPKIDLVTAGVFTEDGQAITAGIRFNF